MVRIALALMLLSPLQLASAQGLPVTEQSGQVEALEASERLGRAIYRHDRAAAVATDALLATPEIDARINGWVTERRGDDIVVTFIGTGDGAEPAAFYRATVSGSGALAEPISVLEPTMALTPFEAGAMAARAAALSSGFEPCTASYNTVVLPADASSGDRWTVYLLPGSTRRDVVPIGGTYRVEVQAGTVVSKRAFTRSCIALQPTARSVAMMITHVLDPMPTEAHVFWSLWADKPMYVATAPNGAFWSITDGSIQPVETGTQGSIAD